MESTETGSIDDSLDSKNLEASMEDIVVAKYEDCNSEVLSSQNEEDQSGEQVYGYLEVRNSGSEDATIYLDSEGFNLNGQRLILTQNDDGNGIIVVVSDETDDQPLEETFAHASVLHTDEVNFEDGLKEHGTLVVDEQSQGLEFIETEEVPQEHEESHVYIENSGGIINISSENRCSHVNSVNIESPLWSVSNNTQLKNDSTEMLFIPNPTVVLAPEETKHRKLMQLACIAHELQSADQKSSSTAVSESAKDTESSLSEFETSVIVTQNEVEKDSNRSLLENSNDEIKNSENSECLPSNVSEDNIIDFNSKLASKSVDGSSLLSCASTRTIDNAVSVIHTTSSELQDNSLENQTKDSSPSDFSSVKNYHNSESDLPSDMLYSSSISRVSLHDSLDEPSSSKQFEECTGEDIEENSQISMADESNESKCLRNNDTSRELECSLKDDDGSPINFSEKSQKSDDVDTLGIEDNPLGDTEADMRVDDGDDDDSHTNSCIVNESKEVDEDSTTTGSKFKDSVINQRTHSPRNQISADADSELSVSDNDDLSNLESNLSTSKNGLPFHTTKYSMYKYKSKTRKQYLTKNSTSSHVIKQDNEMSETNCASDLSESYVKQLDDGNSKMEENNKCESMDFEESPAENLDSQLVIAESIDDEEFNSAATDSNPVKVKSQNITFEKVLESKSTQNTEKSECAKTDSTEKYSKISNPDLKVKKPSDIQFVNKENCDEKSSDKIVPENLDCNSIIDDDFSYNEEPLVKPPKKTYIKKKIKKNVVASKSNIRENIELFSVDDLNFSDCDKDINDVENSLNSDQQKDKASYSHENNGESDDLLSDVQSKVSATYNRKKKSLPPTQRVRTRSSRLRSLPMKLPLENGTKEVSGSESKKNSFDSSSSENLPWGDVLLRTSFQPRVETNDVPSTSFAPQSPIETSTPLITPEQRKRKLNKYKRDFDRLLHSSPVKSKKRKTSVKRQIPRGRKKISQNRKSKARPSSDYSKFLETSVSTPLYNVGASTSSEGLCSREVKKARIEYLHKNYAVYQPKSHPLNNETFTCSSCTFSTKRVNNLIEHLKYCSNNKQPVLEYSVNDMDKRQRIRGDDSLQTTEEVASVNGVIRRNRKNLPQGEYSGGCQNQEVEETDDLDLMTKKKTQYGYGEDDVVWVKFKDRFWPALVWDIKGTKAYVKLIQYPKEVKGLKVKHENIRTFDDAKWNCLCLKEAVNLPNNEIFVKAVQSAETFMRKKFLGFKVSGKGFFSFLDEVDFATDSASSDSIVNEDSDDDDEEDEDEDEQIRNKFPNPRRQAHCKKLDIEPILTYILEGSADDYVLDIYEGRLNSKKHKKFFEDTIKLDLLQRPQFGPCEEKFQQEHVFFHFKNLFKQKIGDVDFSVVSYVCQVWIPEALVKAISVLNEIPIKDAEVLFESEDSLDLEHDPELENIHKMDS